MAKLKTKNVFLDTQVFDSSNLNFDSTSFTELVKLAKAGYVKVFITEVTKSEVEAHIVEKLHEAANDLKRFRTAQRILRNVPACDHFFKDFDDAAAAEEVLGKFEEFLDHAEATVLELDGTEVKPIFDAYFQRKPPFGEGKKKYEFPDAFAQHTLGKWCADKACEMYVVSADGDWQSTEVKGLIPLHKLQEFIDAAVTDYDEDLSALAIKRYETHIDKVKEAVTKAFRESGFITDDVDGDVNDVTVTRLALDDPQLLEVDELSATISVTADLDYTADVSYEDDDEGIWDSEDHTWVYRPTKSVDVEESENLDVEVTIYFDLDDDKVFDVVCGLAKDFSVTVLPSEYDYK
jgi:hypothetical protein